MSDRALSHLRVVEAGTGVAAAHAAKLLADLGADVVKIEPPSGDGTRLFGVVRNGVSGLYLQQNAGKRNVCIDMKAPGGIELVSRLAAEADVIVENYRPGVLDRLGLGWEKLSAANPRLILLSISGFGQTGPDSQRQAYAPIIHAESGWVGRRAELLGEEPPKDSVMSIADSVTALHGMVALLAALHLRHQTGRGQHLDIAMLDSWLATDDYLHFLLDGCDVPVYCGGEAFEAPGGPIMLNRTLPHVWKLLKVYGLKSAEPEGADLATKERCRRAAVKEWMFSFSDRDALKRALEKADLAWGDVRTSANLLSSPSVEARNLAAAVDDGNGGVRLVSQTPYRFSDAEAGVRAGAPDLGQHNAEVLEEWLGLSAADQAAFRQTGALRDAKPAPREAESA